MTAQDYPVTTPYGYVPGYPLNFGFHKGQDRAMPMGTPVEVNGVLIGLSGTNQGVDGAGPHLHVGKFINGAAFNPAGGGFNLGRAVVYDTGEDAVNGKFVRVQTPEALWCYLHLSEVKARKGQVLDMADIFNEGDRVNVNNALFGRDMGFWKDQIGRTYKQAREYIDTSPDFIREQYVNDGDIVNIANKTGWPPETNIRGWLWKRMWYDYASNKAATPMGFEAVTEQLYKKKG